jgi:hypothetical protein
MDIATGLGRLFGCAVVGLVIMMGGDLQMFVANMRSSLFSADPSPPR